jgi:hypothetical protein
LERRQRPVDEEQVHVVEAELGERRIERLTGVLGVVKRVAELAGDEDVAAVEAEARTASPTGLSLPYISAVSTCR